MDQSVPNLRPKPTYSTRLQPLNQGEMRVPDALGHSFPNARQEVASAHPLEQSEKKYAQQQCERQLQMARNAQGLHAPYKLKAEWAITSKIQRLPPLQSSFASLEALLGTDETIAFDDTLNDRFLAEREPDSMAIMRARMGKF